jgi:hypothetical protein
MDGAVMRAAERDGEFVARFAAERPRLQVTKMMRIALPAQEGARKSWPLARLRMGESG